jgi:hypothetical protein
VLHVLSLCPAAVGLQVSGTWDGRMCLWDLRKGSLVREWYSHNERVWAVRAGVFVFSKFYNLPVF